MSDTPPPECRYCGKRHCFVEITDGWPEAAREAYEAAGLSTAATCGRGQSRDMKDTGGWCYARAFYHRKSTLVRTSEEIQAQVSI